MRSLSTMKNLIASLAYEIMVILFGLIVPRLIINTYGSEVNGLTSTINQIILILNLLQAGTVGAAIFQMYKPVAEKDYAQISGIIASSKRFFVRVGIVFFVVAMIVIPVLLFQSDSGIALWEKIFAVLILSLNGVFYFFYIAWLDILFSSHQRRFILSIASILDKALYYGLVFLVIFTKLHFIFLYVATLIGTFVKIAFLYWLYLRDFKPKLVKVQNVADFKIENRTYILCSQISTQVVNSIPTVIITSLYGLAISSVYAVYHLVQNMIVMVARTMQVSVSEVFGNLTVAEEEQQRVKKVYDLLGLVFFLVAMIVCGCAMFLFVPFIYLYTDLNGFDINYLYPMLAIAIVLYCLVYCMYMPSYTLTNVMGLFRQTYLQELLVGIISCVVSVILCKAYWPLVVCGPILYYFISTIYRNYVAKRQIKWFTIKTFIQRYAVLIISVILSGVISFGVFKTGYPTSWIVWIGYGILAFAILVMIAFTYVLLFEKQQLGELKQYAKNILKKLQIKR